MLQGRWLEESGDVPGRWGHAQVWGGDVQELGHDAWLQFCFGHRGNAILTRSMRPRRVLGAVTPTSKSLARMRSKLSGVSLFSCALNAFCFLSSSGSSVSVMPICERKKMLSH